LPEPTTTTRRPRRPPRKRSGTSARAVGKTSTRSKGASRQGTSSSRREDDRVAGSIDDAVVADWTRRQCEPYGHGPTITNPHLLRRIATLAFAGLNEEATASPSDSS
jgi:hypothetical protein